MKIQSLINWIIPSIASIGALSQLSPQVRHYLGPFYPVGISSIMLFLISIFYKKYIIIDTIRKDIIFYLIGIIFIVQASARYLIGRYDLILLSGYIVYPIIIMLIMFNVNTVSQYGTIALERFRILTLIGWTLSLSVGIPSLINNPLIARILTHGGSSKIKEYSVFAISGVGSYSCYTALAIAIAPILAYSNIHKGWKKNFLAILAILSSFAVILSSFTMASGIVGLSYIFIVILKFEQSGKKKKIYWIGIITLLILLSPTVLESLSTKYTNLNHVSAKLTRIISDIQEFGLVEGDETNRFRMLKNELENFQKNPFLGYVPKITHRYNPSYEHSSFGDHLILFGLFGTLLWLLFISCFIIESFMHENIMLRYSLLFAWGLIIFGGILNPIWNNPLIITALIVLTVDIPKREKTFPKFIQILQQLKIPYLRSFNG